MTDNKKEKVMSCPVDDSLCFLDYEEQFNNDLELDNEIINNHTFPEINVIQTNLNHPIYEFYLEICKEIVKVYSLINLTHIQPPELLREIFGEFLDIQPIIERLERNELYPIPSNKIATLLNSVDQFFTRKFMRIRKGINPYFKFGKLIDMKTRLTSAFGTDVANQIVSNYLESQGSRYPLVFAIAEVFFQHTNKFFNTNDLSRIIYAKETAFKDLLKYNYDRQKFLNTLWRLEYYLSNLHPNRKLGFDVDLTTVENISKDSIKEIRKHINQNFYIINPDGFTMIWEVLYALSGLRGDPEPISIQDLSEMITQNDYRYKRQYLHKRMVDYGFNFYSYIAEALLKILAPLMPQNHKALRCIKDYLVNIRKKSLIDIVALYKDAIMPTCTTNKLSTLQRNFMTDIVWRLSCERDWMDGKKMPREWSALHHIRHDPATGLTIHSDNRLKNFACLTINDFIDNNTRVERNWSRWEQKFIIAWEYLRKGMAPPHWSEDERREFSRERKSKNYLDKWIKLLGKYENF